jgi:CRISPR-associated protein Cas5d
MSDIVQEHALDVRGDFACFSRPELSVERYSYPVPTPSAARAIFESVYFKPEFRWQVERIESRFQPAYIALRRNEVKDKISERAVVSAMKGEELEPIWADGDKSTLGTDMKGRTQRQTMALRSPQFRIHARIVPRAGQEDKQRAFDQQFIRRASQGKCFAQPALGCKEFVAFFRLVTDLSQEWKAATDWSQSLGLMLYDTFDLRTNNHAPLIADPRLGWKKLQPFVTLFRAEVKQGVLDIPAYDDPAVLKPEGRVG